MANSIEIIIKSIDQSTAVLKKVEQNTSKLQQKTSKLTAENKKLSSSFSLVKAAAVTYAAILGGRVLKNLIGVGNQLENLEVRLGILFKSTEQGSKAFDVMNKFASKVPFSLEDIQKAAGNLAVVSKDADDLAKILAVTGNVASATGLDFQTTASQIQRAFAGGIASADIFREKGVRSMLGFKQGATVSVEETIAAFNNAFGPGGEYGKSTDLLAQTFAGTLSMINDKVFQFKKTITDQFFDIMKTELQALDSFLATNQKMVEDFAKSIGDVLASAVRGLASVTKFLYENWDAIRITFELLIALKIISWATQLANALRQVAKWTAITSAFTRSWSTLLVGLLVTGAFEYFQALGKEVENLGNQYEDLNKQQKQNNETVGDSVNLYRKLTEGMESEWSKWRLTSETAAYAVGQALVSNVTTAIDNIAIALGRAVVLGDSFKDKFLSIAKILGLALLDAAAQIIATAVVTKLWDLIKGKVKKVWQEITTYIKKVGEAKDKTKDFLDSLNKRAPSTEIPGVDLSKSKKSKLKIGAGDIPTSSFASPGVIDTLTGGSGFGALFGSAGGGSFSGSAIAAGGMAFGIPPGFTTTLSEAFGPTIDNLGKKLGGKFVSGVSDLGNKLGVNLTDMSGILSGDLGSLSSIMDGGLGNLSGTMSAGLDKLAKAVLDAAKKAGKGLLSGIGSAVKSVVPGLASGGPVSSGLPYIVGEEGPELFVPSQNGQIVPNGQMGTQSIGVVNIMPYATIDKALTDKPMSFWVDLAQTKILPALNNLGKSGQTTTLNFRGAR